MNARTEDEQIEAIKRFFHFHGRKILLAIVVVLAAYATYQFWHSGRTAAQETASIYYSELAQLASEDALNDAQRAKFDETFARLAKEYPKSLYAAYGALHKAKLEVQANDLTAAAQSLEWVRDNSRDADIKALASLRLARIALAQGEHDKALSLVSANGGAFAALFEQVKGDVYLDQNDKDKALLAYRKAQSLLQETQGTSAQLLEIKISMLETGSQDKVFPRTTDNANP